MQCDICLDEVDVVILFDDTRVCRPCRDILRASAVAAVGPIPTPTYTFTVAAWTRQVDEQLKKMVLDRG